MKGDTRESERESHALRENISVLNSFAFVSAAVPFHDAAWVEAIQ